MAHQQPPQRPPAPSLFIGPPAQTTTSASFREEPARQAASTYDASNETPLDQPQSAKRYLAGATRRDADTRPAVARDATGSKSILNTVSQQKSQASATEAAWAEMQNTLEEVELGAAGGANAFSAEHSRTLQELRNAQIALAQAWTRSEADDEAVEKGKGQGSGVLRAGSGLDDKDAEGGKMNSSTVLDTRRTAKGSEARGKLGNGGVEMGGARGGTEGKANSGVGSLEEETEKDIILARRRRQANDRYFEQVNRGVADVVERLEIVAKKLKDVETEAQEIWDDDSPDESDSAV